MFDLRAFRMELSRDNPHYERFRPSDLHDLTALLQRSSTRSEQVQAAMLQVSEAKWRKYRRTRAYLLREIPRLPELLGVAIERFRTRTLEALPGGSIRHEAAWQSSTGYMADLDPDHLVREHIYWHAASRDAAPFLAPDYAAAGGHYGVGNAVTTRGSIGSMSDTHDIVGAWSSAINRFDGAQEISYTVYQDYEASSDRGRSFRHVLASYTIVRSVTRHGRSLRFAIRKFGGANESVTNHVNVVV